MNRLCHTNHVVLILTLWPGLCLAQDEPMPAGAAAAPTTTSATPTIAPATLQETVLKLSPESRAKLGEMLAADWKDRPEWVEMLIPLLKHEDMQPTTGWFKPSDKKYDWAWLAARFDKDQDGIIEKQELPGESIGFDRLFTRLDRNYDGKLRSDDFNHAIQPSTPPVMMSRYLSRLLDVDANGRITPEELQGFLKRTRPDRFYHRRRSVRRIQPGVQFPGWRRDAVARGNVGDVLPRRTRRVRIRT